MHDRDRRARDLREASESALRDFEESVGAVSEAPRSVPVRTEPLLHDRILNGSPVWLRVAVALALACVFGGGVAKLLDLGIRAITGNMPW